MFGYAWLLIGSGYWFARSIFDLTLVRRPTVTPNLTTAGLSCMGIALFVGLTSVAVRRTTDRVQVQVGERPAPIAQVQDQATAVVQAGAERNGSAIPRQTILRFWVERTLAMVCHAAVVVGLLMIGIRHFQDRSAGIAMGTLYLLVPYTAYHIGQLHHVWPTAFLVWAIYFYRRPVTSGWLLGLAAGTSLFPALLFPLWFGFYSRRGAGRFAIAFLSAVVVSVGITALVLWLDGRAGFGLAAALHLPDWQPWKVPHTREHLDGDALGVPLADLRRLRRVPGWSGRLAEPEESVAPDRSFGRGADRCAVLARRPRRGVCAVVSAAVFAHDVPPEPLHGRAARTGNGFDGPVGRRSVATGSPRPASAEGTRGLNSAFSRFATRAILPSRLGGSRMATRWQVYSG